MSSNLLASPDLDSASPSEFRQPELIRRECYHKELCWDVQKSFSLEWILDKCDSSQLEKTQREKLFLARSFNAESTNFNPSNVTLQGVWAVF